jgi:inorganic pyrophosphatase
MNREELLDDYLINNGTQEELDNILEKACDDFFEKEVINEDEVIVFIEIGKNSNIKYEYDSKLKALICDRILITPVKYFFNYGFIPDTKADDGDTLDAIVLIDEELISGCFIKCKIVGCLETNDNEGDDPKIIVVPIKNVGIAYENINDIDDIGEIKKDQLVHFFTHYKDLEKNKFVNVKGFVNKEKAVEIYKNSKVKND